MSFGPGESRWVEEKRHYRKPIPISETVNLDRERCILCDRCTRFADEVAGDPLIHFMDRGANTQVNTFPGEPFSSYFSGNTVQICPVGALTATPYRFKARPWDLEEVESTCTGCSVGLPGHGAVVAQPAPPLQRRRLRPGQLVVAVRQGPLRVRGRQQRRPPRSSRWSATATAWSRRAGPTALDHAGTLIREGLDSRRSRGIRRGRRRPPDQRVGLRVGEARQGRHRLRPRRRPARRRPAGRRRARPAAGHHRPRRAAPAAPSSCSARTRRRSSAFCYIRLKHAVVEDGVTLIEITPHADRPVAVRGGVAELPAGRGGRRGRRAAVRDADRRRRRGRGYRRRGRSRQAAALLAAADGPVTVVLGRASVAGVGGHHRRRCRAAGGRSRRRPVPVGAAPSQRARRARSRPGPRPPAGSGASCRRRRAWFGAAWPTVPDADGLDTAGHPAGRRRRQDRHAGAARRRPAWPTSRTASWPSGRSPAPVRDRRRPVPDRRPRVAPTSCSRPRRSARSRAPPPTSRVG